MGEGKPHGLSELRSLAQATTRGFAACLAERLCLSDRSQTSTTSSALAGRPSLPANAEEGKWCRIRRKAAGFPQIGAAEPLVAHQGHSLNPSSEAAGLDWKRPLTQLSRDCGIATLSPSERAESKRP